MVNSLPTASATADKTIRIGIICDDLTTGHQIRRWLEKSVRASFTVVDLDTALTAILDPSIEALCISASAVDSSHGFFSLLRESKMRRQLILIDRDLESVIPSDIVSNGTLLGRVTWPTQRNELTSLVQQFEVKAKESETEEKSFSTDKVCMGIESGYVLPFYQPKVSIPDGQVLGFEALARWREPNGDLFGPSYFIPTAEAGNLIHQLTQMMIEKVLFDLGEWLLAGENFHVSVNATTADLEVPGFADWLISRAESAGVPPANLVIELTESRLTEDPGQMVASVARLRNAGFGVAIDDFGTGYSSLEQLQRVPATELKVDRAFVSGAANDQSKQSILKHSIGLGKSLGLLTIAEGIEDESDWVQVAKLEGDVCQGWFSGKPMPVEDIPAWIASWSKKRTTLPTINNHLPKEELFSGSKLKAFAIAVFIAVATFISVLSQEEAVLEEPRVAVLPRITGVNGDYSFLISGFSESLAHQLTRVPELAMIASTSAIVAAGSGDIAEMALRLDADFIVEVSLQSAGKNADLFVRLVDSETQTAIWSDAIALGVAPQTFERSDVWRIARVLETQIGVDTQIPRREANPIDRLAYQSYLRGLEAHTLRMSDNKSRGESIRLLKSAVQLQPDFAEAWAVLAEALVSASGGPTAGIASDYKRETEAAIAKSLALDPNSARANAAAATWYSASQLDLSRAKHHLDLAVEYGAGTYQTQSALAQYHALVGQPDKALVAIERMASIDPLNTRAAFYGALYKAAFGLFDEALGFMEKCYLERCLGEGFVYMAASTAALTPASPEREQWGVRLVQFGEMVDRMSDAELPAQARLVSSLATIWFQDPATEQAREKIREIYDNKLIPEFFGTMGPTLASILDEDTFFKTLELAVASGEFLAGPMSMFPVYGANPYPDWVLQHPRYHALWKESSMLELAEIYRSRGITAGLPKAPNSEILD